MRRAGESVKTSPIIRVRNGQRKMRLDVARLEQFATRAFERCCELKGAVIANVRGLAEISVILVSDRRMAALHLQFMQVAGPTDVLTFQHGEIVVSAEMAQENARRFGTPPLDEIRLYVVHGFLHLLGFDDRTAKLSRAMEAAQKEVLRSWRRSNESPGSPRAG